MGRFAAFIVLAALLPVTSAQAAAPPFEPVAIQRIDLPAAVTDASTPVFAHDGAHLLFFAGGHLWIVATDSSDAHCLACSAPAISPLTEQEGLATPFPDGRRVFFGPYGKPSVLECSPTVIDCESSTILPVDLSLRDRTGGLVPGGGADLLGAIDIGGGSSPKLAPDGVHIAFSDVRSDAAELMVVATLTRTASGYAIIDPRVINPPGPRSPLDPDTAAWSDSSALYEFKSFANGGADATYVEVGGPASVNPDVWEVNLATGRRTRLTSNPDWDEDDAPSPDGSSLVVESDRTMHRVDSLGGLLPVRGFVDAPEISALASYFVNGPADRECDLQPWLLPATGDDGAALLGEPLQPYSGGDVHASNNVSGYPQWSPDSTAIALNTQSYTTGLSAPYLLVAHLIARHPTAPLPVVSSQPGAWAPSPLAYHGAIESTLPVVLRGAAAGTATVLHVGFGVISGIDSVVYNNYSDDGRHFVTGSTTITDPLILAGPIRVDSDLYENGGYEHVHLRFSGTSADPMTVSGTAVTSYDGTTLTGIPHVPQACPQSLPRAPQLQITATPGLIHVSAQIAGAGADEAGYDSRPVYDATVTAAGHSATTDASGNAQLTAAPGATITATAGDTFAPAQISSTILPSLPPAAKRS